MSCLVTSLLRQSKGTIFQEPSDFRPEREGLFNGSQTYSHREKYPMNSSNFQVDRYRHTQPNLAGGSKTTFLLVALALAGFVAVIILPELGFLKAIILLLALLAAVNAVFSSLTVVITDSGFEYWFGMGVWHKKIPLTEISGSAVVKNSWWYGWGIRLTPHGWLHNVAGLDAVEILLKNGRKIRIGTDEPEKLSMVIERAIR